MSYSKRAHTFRTTVGNTPAARARLGSPSFIDFNKSRPVPSGFVSELRFQHSPACIQDGLRHLGFDELGGADISDDDQGVLAGNPRCRLVKVMFARARLSYWARAAAVHRSQSFVSTLNNREGTRLLPGLNAGVSGAKTR